MVNTNGMRIAQDAPLPSGLASYAPGIEGLICSSTRCAASHCGPARCRPARIRRTPRSRLNELGVSTTLVMTVKRGVNDDEVGGHHSPRRVHACVRGVTLHPFRTPAASRLRLGEAPPDRQ